MRIDQTDQSFGIRTATYFVEHCLTYSTAHIELPFSSIHRTFYKDIAPIPILSTYGTAYRMFVYRQFTVTYIQSSQTHVIGESHHNTHFARFNDRARIDCEKIIVSLSLAALTFIGDMHQIDMAPADTPLSGPRSASSKSNTAATCVIAEQHARSTKTANLLLACLGETK